MPFDARQAPIIFGEVLFDDFADPSGDPGRVTRVLGGAPFNVAWHLRAFGVRPRLISRVGTDALGDAIVATLRAWDMSAALLQRDSEHATGTVRVRLDQGEPSYDILADRAYDHIVPDAWSGLAPGSLLYHGSLATRLPTSRATLRALRERLDPAVFVDVNLRAPWWSPASVEALLDGATWAKFNAQELEWLAPDGPSPEARAGHVLDRHRLAIVYVTLGQDGAFAVTADGRLERVAPDAPVELIDTVGAGDAFAAVLILGLLNDWPLAPTLTRARAFAAAIVGQPGATVADPRFYADFRARFALSSGGAHE